MDKPDDIVGHKTFSTGDPLHPFRHEPLTRADADALIALADAQQEKRAKDMPTEQDAVNAMSSAFQRLRELGWKEACYAPTDTPLKLVEPGSSGIHEGTATGEWPSKSFWIFEVGDQWPSRPCLFKPSVGGSKNEEDK
ncbi:MAG TPA: hypothetical protein VF516_03070 [Kofleriaceae bacterium]